MEFEWDERKRRTNLHKHGIDFVDCEAVFKGSTLTVEDARFDYGERCFVTVGVLKGRVVSVAHTETDRKIRIISVRKATRREEETYFESLGD